MKRLLHSGLMYGFPLACLAALAAAVLWLRAPEQGPAPPREELELWSDLELRYAVDELVERFQRRTGIRVESRYETADRLLDVLEQTGQGELLLAGSRSTINQATHRGFVISAHQVAQRSLSAGREIMPGPPSIHAALLADGAASETAPEFLRFIRGRAGQDVLRRHGYQTVPE